MSLATRLADLATAIGVLLKDHQTQLNGKAGSSHTHGIADLTATGTADSTTFLRGDNTWSVPPGAGGWSEQIVTSDWMNSSVNETDIVAGFTPAASTRYIIDAVLLVESVGPTVGIQTRLAGPSTGITAAGVKIVSAASATTDKIDHLALNSFQAATAGLGTPNVLLMQAIIRTGASPGAGAIRPQGKSEVGLSQVKVLIGSSFRWRAV